MTSARSHSTSLTICLFGECCFGESGAGKTAWTHSTAADLLAAELQQTFRRRCLWSTHRGLFAADGIPSALDHLSSCRQQTGHEQNCHNAAQSAAKAPNQRSASGTASLYETLVSYNRPERFPLNRPHQGSASKIKQYSGH